MTEVLGTWVKNADIDPLANIYRRLWCYSEGEGAVMGWPRSSQACQTEQRTNQ